MRIITTSKHGKDGNDCYIESTVTVYEHDNVYKLQLDTNVTGWCASKESKTLDLQSSSEGKALNKEVNQILRREGVL